MAKKHKRKFHYTKRSKEATVARSQQTGYAEGDPYITSAITVFTPKDGDNTLRILPPTWDEADHYGIDIFLHYQIGADKNTYICPERAGTGKCPICEERHQLEADGEGDSDHAKGLRTSKRALIYIIDRDEEEKGIQAWPMSWTMDRDYCNLAVDKRSGEVYALDDPEEGFDIEFTRKGKGIQTKYNGVAISRRESSLDNDEALDFAVENPLPEQIIVYDYDHIAEAFGASENNEQENSSSTQDKDNEYTLKDVKGMEFDDLLDVVDDEELDIPDADNMEEDALRDAVAEELGLQSKKKKKDKKEKKGKKDWRKLKDE